MTIIRITNNVLSRILGVPIVFTFVNSAHTKRWTRRRTTWAQTEKKGGETNSAYQPAHSACHIVSHKLWLMFYKKGSEKHKARRRKEGKTPTGPSPRNSISPPSLLRNKHKLWFVFKRDRAIVAMWRFRFRCWRNGTALHIEAAHTKYCNFRVTRGLRVPPQNGKSRR
jgi:hypothetical protein